MDTPEQPNTPDNRQPHNPASDSISDSEKSLYDLARQSNQESWQAIADEANDLRPVIGKVLKRGIVTPGDVMHDEALRANEYVDRDVQARARFDERNAENIKIGREPWPTDDEPGQTPQEAYERLQRTEVDEGSIRGRSPYEERLFDPEVRAEMAGREFRQREERISPISSKAVELLEKGDILGADGALSRLENVYSKDKDLTVREHIEPALRSALARIFISQNGEKLGELLDSKFLARYMGKNITQDIPAVTPEMRHSYTMKEVVVSRVRSAVKDFDLLLQSSAPGRYPAEELKARVGILTRVGVMTTDEMRHDYRIINAVNDMLADRLLEMVSHGSNGLYFPSAGEELEKLGLVDRQSFIQNQRVRRAAILALVEETPELHDEAEAALQATIIKQGQLPRGRAVSIQTKGGTSKAMEAQAQKLSELPTTDEATVEQLSDLLKTGESVILEYNVISPDYIGRLERNYDLRAKTLAELADLIKQRRDLESDNSEIRDALIKLPDGKHITLDKLGY